MTTNMLLRNIVKRQRFDFYDLLIASEEYFNDIEFYNIVEYILLWWYWCSGYVLKKYEIAGFHNMAFLMADQFTHDDKLDLYWS